MGGTKRLLEDEQAKQNLALEIALEAGVLQRCEYHDDAIFRKTYDDSAAYKIANHRFSKGELSGTFDDRKQMTDTIKDVVEGYTAEECMVCAKIRDED